MGAWKKARHDGARNILIRLNKAVGLREGADMDVEVPFLFTRHRPSDIRVRIRPDMHHVTCISRTVLEGQWLQVAPTGSSRRALAPGHHPLGTHGLQGHGLRRGHRSSNANVQQRPIRPLLEGHSSASGDEKKI